MHSQHTSAGPLVKSDVNIWLDDERPEPEGYIRVMSARSCIIRLDLLSELNKSVNHLSLDHDLGEGAGCGYDVVTWLEEQVFTNDDYVPPFYITVHSANAGARKKMLLGIEALQRRFRHKTDEAIIETVKASQGLLEPNDIVSNKTASAYFSASLERLIAAGTLINENNKLRTT